VKVPHGLVVAAVIAAAYFTLHFGFGGSYAWIGPIVSIGVVVLVLLLRWVFQKVNE
jgi:hypothetical protein